MTCNGALVIAHLLDSDNQSGLLDFRNKELCIIGTNSLSISLFHSYDSCLCTTITLPRINKNQQKLKNQKNNISEQNKKPQDNENINQEGSVKVVNTCKRPNFCKLFELKFFLNFAFY